MSLTVSIDKNDVTGQVLAAAGPITERESKAIAGELARLVQRHLRMRDKTNAHTYPDGGRRSHFWQKAAQSVTFSTDAEGMSVAVSHQGVRLRYAGAPDGIRPVNAKALAIPACAETYGRSPREYVMTENRPIDVVVFKSKNKVALVDLFSMHVDHEFKVLFWLVKKTKPIAPDHTVLPPANVVLGLSVMRLNKLRARKVQPNG